MLRRTGSLLVSLRLNPRDPATAMAGGAIAASYYMERRYAEAVEAARHCLTDHPAYHAPRRFLVAGLGQMGETTKVLPPYVSGSCLHRTYLRSWFGFGRLMFESPIMRN